MSSHKSLLDFERDVRRIHLMDGLVDIMLGIFLVLMSLWIVNRFMIFHLVWLFVSSFIIEVVRKKITYPRVGYVKFRNPILFPLFILFASICIIAILSGIIALIASLLHLPLHYNMQHIIILATMIYVPIIFTALAYHHKAYRWIVYGFLIAILMLLGMITNSTIILYLFISTGIIITVIGGITFIKFLRTREPHSMEVNDVRTD